MGKPVVRSLRCPSRRSFRLLRCEARASKYAPQGPPRRALNRTLGRVCANTHVHALRGSQARTSGTGPRDTVTHFRIRDRTKGYRHALSHQGPDHGFPPLTFASGTGQRVFSRLSHLRLDNHLSFRAASESEWRDPVVRSLRCDELCEEPRRALTRALIGSVPRVSVLRPSRLLRRTSGT